MATMVDKQDDYHLEKVDGSDIGSKSLEDVTPQAENKVRMFVRL
jgi:hypothetical protein